MYHASTDSIPTSTVIILYANVIKWEVETNVYHASITSIPTSTYCNNIIILYMDI